MACPAGAWEFPFRHFNSLLLKKLGRLLAKYEGTVRRLYRREQLRKLCSAQQGFVGMDGSRKLRLRPATKFAVACAVLAGGAIGVHPALVGAGVFGNDGEGSEREDAVEADQSPSIDEANRRTLAVLDGDEFGITGEFFSGVTSDYVLVQDQTCFRIVIEADAVPDSTGDGPSEMEGCWDQAVVEAGQAYVRLGTNRGLLFGVAPSNVSDVQIGDRTVPTNAGVWAGTFGPGLREIRLIAGEQRTGRIILPPPADAATD